MYSRDLQQIDDAVVDGSRVRTRGILTRQKSIQPTGRSQIIRSGVTQKDVLRVERLLGLFIASTAIYRVFSGRASKLADAVAPLSPPLTSVAPVPHDATNPIPGEGLAVV